MSTGQFTREPWNKMAGKNSPSQDQNKDQTQTQEAIPSKEPHIDWITLQNNLCPRALLETIAQSASNQWSLTTRCGQGKKEKSTNTTVIPRGLWVFPSWISLRSNIRSLTLYKKEEIDVIKIIQSLKNKQANKNNIPWWGGRYPELLQYII